MKHSAETDAGQPSVRAPADRSRVLLEINNAIVSHLDLVQTLKAISACLRREMRHDIATLALYNEERQELRMHALDFAGLDWSLEQGTLIPLVGTPAALAFSTRKPVLRHRPDFEEFTADIMKEAYARGIKSGCAVPLLFHDKIVGAMTVASLRESAFTEDDADLLAQIGTQVAIAVNNALNYERLKDAESEVSRERDRTKLLLEINNAVVAHLDLHELIKSISGVLRRIVPHDGAFFTLVDSETNRLQVQALDMQMLGKVPFEEGVSISPEGTPEDEAIKSGRAVLVVPHIDLQRFHNPWVRNASEKGVKSGCAVPLIAHGRTLGALSVVSQKSAAFTKDHALLLEQCSGQMAIAVENALNYEAARKERDRSRLLLEVNNAVISHLSLGELLKSISASLHRIIHHDAAFITLFNSDLRAVRVLAFDLKADKIPVNEQAAFETWLAMDATPEGEAIQTRQPVLVRHQSEVARFSEFAKRQAEAAGVQSGCAVPLIVQGEPIGTLSVVSFRDDAFTLEDVMLLNQSANQIAIAVQNALNFESARAAESEAKLQRDRSRLLLEVNNAVVSHLNLTELLKSVSRRLQELMFNDSAFIALSGPEETLEMLAIDLGRLGNVGFKEGMRVPMEGTPEEQAIKTGREVLMRSVADVEKFPSPWVRYAIERGIKSGCINPLVAHGKTLGALGVVSLREEAFTQENARLLAEISGQIAIAVENALNFEKTRQAEQVAKHERDRSKLLLDINNALVSHLDLTELVRAISNSLQSVVPNECVALAIYDSDTDKLFAQAVSSVISPMPEGIYYDPEGTTSGLVFKSGKPLYLPRPDYESFSSPVTHGFYKSGLKSLYSMPIGIHGRKLGVMSISSVREDAFTKDDQELFQQIANQVAIAAANALSVRDLEALKNKLAQEKLYLEDEIRNELNFDEIVGQSPVLKQVLKLVETVAASDSTVLLLGETGTGKELIARAVHEHSRRKSRTFVKLNCAAIPTGLLESELFGHEKGAFTGAIAQKIGRLELADQGTLFLDEVGDIPIEIQPKLLRALQEREFERLGSTHTKKVNVRLVAATNRDLEKMIEERQFRGDLYYRLNVFPIQIPPLRERQEDIPLLVRYFAEKFARQMQKPIDSIPTETMSKLQRWHWPGNIRELENLIERAVILTTGTALQVPLPEIKPSTVNVPAVVSSRSGEEGDREHIIKILRETGGMLGGPNGAAARLGIKRTTLQYKIKKMGITRNHWFPNLEA